MMPTHSGSFRFFRFSGIQVFVHWSWFVVAFIELFTRRQHYASPAWNVAEYCSLFLIVLLHEFGHAFACRQTGGQANQIVLWPLGGVAYVAPPQRAGAILWSIAAGPLVNVVLYPILFGLILFGRAQGWARGWPDGMRLILTLHQINLGLLIFNLLPVYPLDGGQILRSLLWFGLGRARSLQVATIIGFIGIAGLVGLAIWWESIWFGIMAVFLGQRCWIGFREAQGLTVLARIPRHTGLACPVCREAPPGGPIWLCRACRNSFDPFSTHAVCPHCQTPQPTTTCVHCGAAEPIDRWSTAPRGVRGEPPVIDV